MGSRNGGTIMKWVTDIEREAMAGVAARRSCNLSLLICLVLFAAQVQVTYSEEPPPTPNPICRKFACPQVNMCKERTSSLCYNEVYSITKTDSCSEEEKKLAKAYYTGYNAIENLFCGNNSEFQSSVKDLQEQGCWKDFNVCIAPQRGVFDGAKLTNIMCEQLWVQFIACREKQSKKCHKSAVVAANSLYDEMDCGKSKDRESGSAVPRPFATLFALVPLLFLL